jgi:hypothetical protein
VINVGGGLHLYGLEQLDWDLSTPDRQLADSARHSSRSSRSLIGPESRPAAAEQIGPSD